MVLRKITIDNSVIYIPITEKTINKTRQKIKKFNLLQEVNKTKNFQKIIKNLLKILQLVDLEYLQNRMYMYNIL